MYVVKNLVHIHQPFNYLICLYFISNGVSSFVCSPYNDLWVNCKACPTFTSKI